ncbi:PREDICTED: meiotic recombination protein SPO11 [Nicrophorus vespilloides]|uniref:DNA topoisomerase (ATP-hydrolyzing) n=1 Tax=Nicrophorus vespilloides TaxID=110193 RepID=A0ABM1M471_NICVS|nr:PREDICTED: meiotic recombination protein SPO11 [Nicrophorus vespilloides]
MDKFLEAKDLSQSNKTIPDCIISPMYTFSENYIDLNEAFTNVEIFILKVNAEMDLQEDEESLIDYVNAQMSDVKKHRITSKNNLKIDFQITDKKLQASIDSMLNDKEMVYTSCDFIEYKDNTNLILRKIINIFSALCNRVLKNEKLELTWQKPNYWKDVDYLDNILVCNKPNSMTHTKLNNTRSKARFTIMIYLLKKIYNLLMVDSHINQREIYYQIINYVSSSNQVFSAIDTVSALLKEGTYDLKILSTSKGLAFGNLKIIMKDGEVIKYNKKGGTLIPNIVKNIKDIEASAFFILVVEKDAVFQKLSQENISQKIGRPFILITGKGYPDFSTRLFLKILWKLLSIPIFILADCDPYGIEIMLCYKYGSLSLHMFEELAVPNARWLGVHPSELNLLNIACKKMTENDMRKIRSIAKRSYMRSEPRIGEELKLLLKKRQKAEIEGLIKSNNFLSNFYLPNKLYTKDFM